MSALSQNPEGSTRLRFAALALALVAGTVFFAAIAQHESGRYFTKDISLERELSRSTKAGEFGYRVSLPKAYHGISQVIEQTLVLENGKPLPLRIEKVDQNFVPLFEKHQLDSFVQGNRRTVRWCPGLDCKYAVLLPSENFFPNEDGGEERHNNVFCEACQTTFCFQHGCFLMEMQNRGK